MFHDPLQEVFGHFSICTRTVVIIIEWCHFFLRSSGLSNHIKQKRELAIPGKSCLQWKLYLMPAKAIKPNNNVSELDPAILFEEDLSLFHHVVTVKVLVFKKPF